MQTFALPPWSRLMTWWKGQLHVPRPSSVEELSTARPTQSNLPRDLVICVCIATAEFVLLLDTDILPRMDATPEC